MGSHPTLLCTPPHPNPFPLCLRVCLCGRVHTSPVPSPPTPHPPPLIAAIPVAAGCHSAVTPLPIVFGGGIEGGGRGRRPQPSPRLPPPPLPEVPAVVRVGVTVFCDNHSVGELATRQALHGFLAVKHRGELHEDLRDRTRGRCEGRTAPLPPEERSACSQPPASMHPPPELRERGPGRCGHCGSADIHRTSSSAPGPKNQNQGQGPGGHRAEAGRGVQRRGE